MKVEAELKGEAPAALRFGAVVLVGFWSLLGVSQSSPIALLAFSEGGTPADFGLKLMVSFEI